MDLYSQSLPKAAVCAQRIAQKRVLRGGGIQKVRHDGQADFGHYLFYTTPVTCIEQWISFNPFKSQTPFYKYFFPSTRS